MLTNPVKHKLATGGGVVGVFVGSRDARLVELCGYAGFDYVLLDAEHYAFSDTDIENLVRAAEVVGVPAFVRVQSANPDHVRRALDLGAWGVMLPQVRDRRDVETASISAALYAPLGSRGASVTRVAEIPGATMSFGDWAALSNREVMVIVQVETKDAVDNLDDLLSIPGIDAFEMGRSDLSQSLGLPGQGDHPTVQSYVERAESAILAAGRALGDTTDDISEAAELVHRGYRMVACNLNRLALRSGRSYAAAVHAEQLGVPSDYFNAHEDEVR